MGGICTQMGFKAMITDEITQNRCSRDKRQVKGQPVITMLGTTVRMFGFDSEPTKMIKMFPVTWREPGQVYP